MTPASGRLLTLVVLAAGCANLPYQTPAGQIPGTSNPGTQRGGTIPNVRGSAEATGSREICRGSPFPRGWIAVDYIGSSAACSNSLHDSGANTAIIVNYSVLRAEAMLTVCADQHLPGGWERLPEEETDAASSQCPRRPGDTRKGPTIAHIRKLR
jgi:hypothetical protein